MDLEARLASHSLDPHRATYARLGVIGPERALEYDRFRVRELLESDGAEVAAVVEADALRALAIATPKDEVSRALGCSIGELSWLSLDSSLSPLEREAALESLLAECQKWKQRFQLVTALVDFDRTEELAALQEHGARVCGANLNWVGRLSQIEDRVVQHPMVKRATLSFDEAALLECVRASYDHYRSHYHADRRIDASAVSASYVAIVCEHVQKGGLVAVVQQDGAVDGFSTINPHPINVFLGEDRVGEVEMSGTSPTASTPGAYEATLRRCLAWFKERGYRFVLFGCKADNFAVQSVWTRLGGLTPRRFRYRLHWWLDS